MDTMTEAARELGACDVSTLSVSPLASLLYDRSSAGAWILRLYQDHMTEAARELGACDGAQGVFPCQHKMR